jgi:hypothetical protein
MRLRSGKTITYFVNPKTNIQSNTSNINNTSNIDQNKYKNINKRLDNVFDTIRLYLATTEANQSRYTKTSKLYWVSQTNVILQLYSILLQHYDDIYQEGKSREVIMKFLNVTARKALNLIADLSHVYNKHKSRIGNYKILEEFNNYERTMIHNCIKFLIFYVKKTRENDLLKIM